MQQAIRQRPNIDLRGITVLVVEDNYYLASEISAALSRHDATIAGPAANLDHALELLATTKLDCAVLDINVHGEFTFELAQELRQCGVPLIFTTGYDEKIIPSPLLDAVLLEKPVNLSELVRAVRASTRRATPMTPSL
jgi:DNA-binding response OmpR family regulator